VNHTISGSQKGCPWENGYQESFYGKFKVDLGDPKRFTSLGELTATIYERSTATITNAFTLRFACRPRNLRSHMPLLQSHQSTRRSKKKST
jgi:hypothetical protein